MPGLRAVVDSAPTACLGRLVAFRAQLYRCFGRRADALFELVDAVLTAEGPVDSLVGLSEQKAFRRGHGALYDALACGEIDVEALAGLLVGSWDCPDDGPVKIAVDVSAWPRPDAVTSQALCHCYTACRCDGARKTIPGWPFSFAAGLEWGASSWTALLDAVRIGPHDDATVVTVGQLAQVLARLAAAGILDGRPAPVFVFDSGYDLTRITFLATQRGAGVQILGRVRRDRPPTNGCRGTTRATAPSRSAHGTGCTRNCANRPAGPASTARYRPWPAPSSASRSNTYPATVPPPTCGCGTPRRPAPSSTWACSGRPTFDASTWNTRSGCSSRRWAGPPHRSALPNKASAGPG